MNEQPSRNLLPVTPEELEQAVSHALRFDGRKHFKLAGEIMGKITAAHLVHCLTQAGFVVMKAPPPDLPQVCAYAESARRVIDAATSATCSNSQDGKESP